MTTIHSAMAELRDAADRAYCRYVTICQTANEIAGADVKMADGKFRSDNLGAHKRAAEEYGRHCAYANAVKLLEDRPVMKW